MGQLEELFSEDDQVSHVEPKVPHVDHRAYLEPDALDYDEQT